MLLGQELGGSHQRRLITVLDRQQRREQRHDRLAAADVALEQPMHAVWAGHVHPDLANRSRLGSGEWKRQRRLELRRQVAAILERNPLTLLTRQDVRAPAKQVNEQE